MFTPENKFITNISAVKNLVERRLKDCEMLAKQETLMEYELEIEKETLTKEYDCLK